MVIINRTNESNNHKKEDLKHGLYHKVTQWNEDRDRSPFVFNFGGNLQRKVSGHTHLSPFWFTTDTTSRYP